jgi:hypothetical protein
MAERLKNAPENLNSFYQKVGATIRRNTEKATTVDKEIKSEDIKNRAAIYIKTNNLKFLDKALSIFNKTTLENKKSIVEKAVKKDISQYYKEPKAQKNSETPFFSYSQSQIELVYAKEVVKIARKLETESKSKQELEKLQKEIKQKEGPSYEEPLKSSHFDRLGNDIYSFLDRTHRKTSAKASFKVGDTLVTVHAKSDIGRTNAVLYQNSEVKNGKVKKFGENRTIKLTFREKRETHTDSHVMKNRPDKITKRFIDNCITLVQNKKALDKARSILQTRGFKIEKPKNNTVEITQNGEAVAQYDLRDRALTYRAANGIETTNFPVNASDIARMLEKVKNNTDS